ncbi:MAG: FtsQ-type POTRA domain-containing protein [Polyangiaceae bacterium]|nr:FtsQ-type POTRA domain-containing protein [Polyangiaceae bacterium]MCW5790684.1 FtsQ-type POTRA domain-containing protein [Polyangiaceae bacterium]
MRAKRIEAPDELGYVPSESPPPPRARRKRGAAPQAARRTNADLPGFWSRLWSGVKLASGVLVVLGAAVALAWGLHRYALTTPRFAIEKIDVTGAKRIRTDQMLKRAEVKRGDNLLAVDVEALEKKLLEDPWIVSAKVERRIPQTLAIRVEEREVAALASIGGELFLVSRSGEPFKQHEPGDPLDLPVITGVSAEDFARDRARQIDRIAVGIQVLRQYARVPMSKVHAPQEVNLGDSGDVVLTIGKSGMALHLGRGPWRSKLLMAWRVMGSLSKQGRLPRVVFLDNRAHPERVVVRMK